MSDKSEEHIDAEELARRKAAIRLAKKLAKKEKKALVLKLKMQSLKREEFEREKGFVAVTYDRAAEDWDNMMENINHLELRAELDTLWGQITHTIDRKECHIQRLMQDKQDAQNQFQRCARGHEESIAYMKKIYKLMLSAMRDLYEFECYNTTAEYLQEHSYTMHISQRNKTIFENILLASNTTTNRTIDSNEKEFLFDEEDCTNHHIEVREDKRSQICRNMTSLHAQMCNAIRYLRSTSMTRSRLKFYQNFVKREELDTNRFAEIARKTMTMQTDLLQLLNERRGLQLHVMDMMSAIKLEKEYFIECFLHVRSRYEDDMRKDERNTRRVASAANRALDFLREIDRKGTILMGICQSCRKLETMKEKIEPSRDEDSIDKKNMNPFHKEKAVRHLHEMRHFLMRTGNVEAHNVALIEERNNLQRENKTLLELIRRYCAHAEYGKSIMSLRLSSIPTVSTPCQEASHMALVKHIRKNDASK